MPVIVSKGAAAADSAPANIRAATTRPMRTYDGTTLRSKVAERKLAARRGGLQAGLLRRTACQLGMLRAVRKTMLSLAAAAALLAWPATAAADNPIPESDTSAQAFFGTPAAQNPIFGIAEAPRHPFMAPNEHSNLHTDAWQ